MLRQVLRFWARPARAVLSRREQALGSLRLWVTRPDGTHWQLQERRGLASDVAGTVAHDTREREKGALDAQEELLSTVEELLSKPWTGEFESNLEPLEPCLKRAEQLLSQAQAFWDAGRAPTGASPLAQDRAYVHDLHLLFLVKEMVPTASLMAETALDLLRARMDESGPLGNEVKPKSSKTEAQIEETIHAYEKATQRLETAREKALRDAPVRAALWDRAIRKWEQDLGIHILQLRQTVSMEHYSERFGTVAAHRIVPAKGVLGDKSGSSA